MVGRVSRLVIACLVFAGPVAAQPGSDADQIRRLRGQSNDAIASHDVPGILSFLDDEFQATGGNGSMLQGGTEMGRVLTRQFEDLGDVIYVRTIESVEVSASAPLAAEVGTWVGTWLAPGGSVRTGGRYAASWRKGERGWVIRSELFITLFCEGAGCA